MWQPLYTPPYYDFRAIEEKNPSIAILLGARGLGKTNYYKRKAIYNFLNTGKKTIFMKRFKKEVKEFRDKFLNDIYKADERLKKVKIVLKGNHIYVEGKQAIEFISLSQSIQLTGVSYEDVTLLVFDEFLTLGQTIRGIKEETLFLHFLETCFRDREDFKIVMLSNAVSTTSNYFTELGFNKPINPSLKYQSPPHTKDIIVEVYDDINFKQHKEDSKLYKLFSRSQYKKFAIENEFILEDNTNILNRKNIKGHIKELFTIATSDGFLNVALFDKIKYFVYHSKSINSSLITFDKEQVTCGATYITNNHLIAMNLTSAIISKLIFYNDMKVKKQFLENLKKIVTTFY